MVNYGPSKGCETCKQRRKKCDETRPCCNRCIRAKRVCPGYKDGFDILIRYENRGKFASLHPVKQQEAQRFNIQSITPPAQLLDPALDESERQRRALVAFYDDYCVEPVNRSISRGFLDGLEPLIAHAGPGSDIARAAKIVALAGAGNRTGQQDLTPKTEHVYGHLLRSFQETLSEPDTSNTKQSLMTAVLLGIYEIITSTESNPGQHVAHVRGVAAILAAEVSPFDIFAGTQLFQLGNPLLMKKPLDEPRNTGVLCAPIVNTHVQHLDAILIKFNPMFHRANALLSDTATACEDLEALRADAMALRDEFRAWSANQIDEWQAKRVTQIIEGRVRQQSFTDCWPKSVDYYHDFYVAAVWNTYRKTHLMILDIILRCLTRLTGSEHHPGEREEAQRLTNDIIASIPYHLVADLPEYVAYAHNTSDMITPGKPAGGLLLLHPLYVATRQSIVSAHDRNYMSECLAWIGKRMGIHQALLLADPNTTLPFQYIAEGHILIWAAMLIQRV